MCVWVLRARSRRTSSYPRVGSQGTSTGHTLSPVGAPLFTGIALPGCGKNRSLQHIELKHFSTHMSCATAFQAILGAGPMYTWCTPSPIMATPGLISIYGMALVIFCFGASCAREASIVCRLGAQFDGARRLGPLVRRARRGLADVECSRYWYVVGLRGDHMHPVAARRQPNRSGSKCSMPLSCTRTYPGWGT